MPSDRTDQALLTIKLHGEEARSFVIDMTREIFREDRRTFHAVTRCLEIIYEATHRLTEPMKARYPHLPWRDIADAGNVYRHEYDHVAADFVFKTATVDLPVPLAAVSAELARPPRPPPEA